MSATPGPLLAMDLAPAHAANPRLATDPRIGFIDNARAIGIVLVVLGHAPALPGWASDQIYAFHMPLFFLLSGLVVSRDRLALPLAQRAVLLARTLLLPYLFYFGIAFAWWLVAKRHGLRADEFERLPWWDPVIGLVDGNADHLYVDVVLWFFPCLFLTALLHHVVCRYLRPAGAALAFAIVAVAFILARTPEWPRAWWSADCACVAVAFYAAGAAFNPWLRHPRASPRRASQWFAAVAALGLGAVLATWNGHVDLNRLEFGAMPWLYLPVAALGIVGTFLLSSLLPPTRLARWLSTNTIVIFPLHFLFFSVWTGIAIVVFGMPPSFKNESAALAVLYTGLALLACRPAVPALRRGAPWLFPRAPSTRRGSLR